MIPWDVSNKLGGAYGVYMELWWWAAMVPNLTPELSPFLLIRMVGHDPDMIRTSPN